MAITIEHQPSFAVVGNAAGAAGLGRYNQRQQDIALQQQQQNIENAQREQAMLMQQQRMAYGMYADQQQRRDRLGEMQFQRENMLDNRRFQVAMDDRNFGQQKQLQQERFDQQVNLMDLRAQAEAEAEAAKKKAMEDAITMDHTPEDKLKIQQLDQLQRQVNSDNRYSQVERAAIIAAKQAQLGIGEKVPVNQELLKDLNSRTVQGENGMRLIRKANGDYDLHPEDKFKLETQKEEVRAKAQEVKIELDQKKSEQEVFATAQRDYQRDTNSYITDRQNFIEKQVSSAMEQRRKALSAKDDEGNLVDPKSVPEVDPAKIRTEAEGMYDQMRDKPKYIDYFPFAEQAGGAAMSEALAPMRNAPQQVPPQQMPPQQVPPRPVANPPVVQQPFDAQQFEQRQANAQGPMRSEVVGNAVAQQAQAMTFPKNSPAYYQHKKTREKFVSTLGGDVALDEDKLHQAYAAAEVQGNRAQFDRDLQKAIDVMQRLDQGKTLSAEEKKNLKQYADLYLDFIRKG